MSYSVSSCFATLSNCLYGAYVLCQECYLLWHSVEQTDKMHSSITLFSLLTLNTMYLFQRQIKISVT